MSGWAYKWKMSFNPDLNKQTQEVIFFNNALVVCANWQKSLGMFLDESLNFSYHIKEKNVQSNEENRYH